MRSFITLSLTLFLFSGCMTNTPDSKEVNKKDNILSVKSGIEIEARIGQYEEVELDADLGELSENQKEILKKLIMAAQYMDDVYWMESFGGMDTLSGRIEGITPDGQGAVSGDADAGFKSNEALKQYVRINYGPWDRINGNEPFVEGYGEKPEGANFYPLDMTREEFENADIPNKKSQYTLIRRDESGALNAIWYHEAFKDQHEKAAELLREAAELTENENFRRFLLLRADALMTDDYQQSDLAWLEMKDNDLDVVIGPIETYEDKLFGYKAAHESFVLIKDKEWSERLSKYAALLPRLQENLPVEDIYKVEKPGTNSDLNAYEAVYYAGDANAGSKTIAINLPNDEEVQLLKGTRRLQLKNSMKAKFDRILVPISEVLITPEQRNHITFTAFFGNTMFHEVAHGLGIKHTINDKGTVRDALKEEASALEEGKADILGLYMITKLHEWGELEGDLMDYYTTFFASIFRSVRFGASSAHGRANMIRFNYFKEKNAFTRQEDGTYRVNFDEMQLAMKDLSALILQLQGNGDYEGVKKLMEDKGEVKSELKADLNRLNEKGIPKDIIFKQGIDVLGL